MTLPEPLSRHILMDCVLTVEVVGSHLDGISTTESPVEEAVRMRRLDLMMEMDCQTMITTVRVLKIVVTATMTDRATVRILVNGKWVHLPHLARHDFLFLYVGHRYIHDQLEHMEQA